MKGLLRLTIFGLLFAGCASVFAQKPDFNGSWTMDRARSFGLPGNMNQTMGVTQTAAEITVETKLIQPGNERTVKDTYVLDGKEHEYTPQVPAGQPIPKGKRTADWMPGGIGLLVTEVTTTETPKGLVTGQVVRKWTITSGELVIAMYVDNPNASYEAKRIFKKNP
jgi:hypothetical protein